MSPRQQNMLPALFLNSLRACDSLLKALNFGKPTNVRLFIKRRNELSQCKQTETTLRFDFTLIILFFCNIYLFNFLLLMSQVGIREHDAKKMRSSFSSNNYQSLLVAQKDSLNTLASSLTEMNPDGIWVVKPDQLFGKRGKY